MEPQTTTATLTVRRTSPDDSQDRELYVSLNGGASTILRYGDSMTVPIAAGHHRIRVHNTWQWKRAEFDASPGDHIQFGTANLPSRNFGVIATFLGFAPMHTRLERE